MNDRVRASYDQIGEAYTTQRDDLATGHAYLKALTDLLRPNATVLDIGCGAGVPIDRLLIENGFRIMGVDISPKQIERARDLNPTGAYQVRDMLDLKPGDYQVEAVVSFFAIFHVSRDHHAALLKVIRSFLQPGGLLLITMGAGEDEGWDDFFGSEMFWSHYAPEQNRAIVEAADFEVLLDEIDTSADERHQVLVARALV